MGEAGTYEMACVVASTLQPAVHHATLTGVLDTILHSCCEIP